MRNLTIKRHKSFVGCAVKDKIYIRDELTGTTRIEGVPCRKLGEVKNGKEATFQISDEEQEIFVIADELSKEYCNASVTVPAGTEDVAYAGKHHFVLGSNPFRFDGQEVTPDQKRKGKKGRLIFWLAVAVGAVVGLLIGLNAGKPAEKTFTKGDFTITLTEEFTQIEADNVYTSFETSSVFIWTLREDKQLFEDAEDLTLEQYGKLVMQSNGLDVPLSREHGRCFFEFTQQTQGQDVYYMAVCNEGEDAFWVTFFTTPVENKEVYQDSFIQWAKSIKVDEH